MTDDTPQSGNSTDGLHEKYQVSKSEDAVENCFVLEPQSDDAAREALLRYAEVTNNTELATDLREWVAELNTQPSEKALKFAQGPATTLALAQKEGSVAATIRYNDEKNITTGDEPTVLSAKAEEPLGTATVEHAETVPIREALGVVKKHEAEYGIESAAQLISTLRSYYDTDEITMSTEVKVLLLDPDMTIGTKSNCGIHQEEDIYELDRNGICQNCGYIASVVSHGHSPVEGDYIDNADDWVRCDLSRPEDKPETVCLCGEGRFKDAYRSEERRLTMEGKIVLTCGLYGHPGSINITSDEKEMLERLQKQKIDRADRIHIINVDGCIGDITQSKIEYARENNKKISWLEPQKGRVPNTSSS